MNIHQRLHPRHFGDLFSNIPIGLAIWQLENLDDARTFRIVASNRAAEETTGMMREEFLGKTVAEAFPPVFTTELPEMCAEVVRTGRTHTLEEFPYEDERIPKRIFSVRAFPLPDRCVGIAFENITERKRLEEALREERDRSQRYLDIAGVVLLVLEADQTVALINRKGCEVLGFEKEEIIGKNWVEHFCPEWDRGRVKACFARLVAGDVEPMQYFENPVLTRSGEERTIAWHHSLLADAAGNVRGTLSSGEDITEQKRAYEQIRRFNEQLKEMVEQQWEQTGENGYHSSISLETYLELTWERILQALFDLKHLTENLPWPPAQRYPCHLLDCPRLKKLTISLEEAIQVLEKTKSAFKSKELGELRRRLERVVRDRET